MPLLEIQSRILTETSFEAADVPDELLVEDDDSQYDNYPEVKQTVSDQGDYQVTTETQDLPGVLPLYDEDQFEDHHPLEVDGSKIEEEIIEITVDSHEMN